MRGLFAFLFMLISVAASPALAQPADLPIAPATTDQYPAGVKIGKGPKGPVYTNRKGQTLYGLDMRTLLRAGVDPAQYCAENCGTEWEPLLAPKDAVVNIAFPRAFGGRQPPVPAGFVSALTAPDWSIIKGPKGPQWVYKGWHMAYVRKDEKKGGVGFDGLDNFTWNSLKFVPPVPKVMAPSGVAAKFVDGAYALADKDGHLLFTGKCTSTCAEWTALPGGLASAGLGEWRVSADGDRPQWTFKGLPVYVSDDGSKVPSGGKVMRP